MSVSGGGNLYPNWLGNASLTIPNNQVVVNGQTVNVVPVMVGTSSNLTTWTNQNQVTFFTASNLAAGTYLVGAETFCDPLPASNAGAGWQQGDAFALYIRDKDGQSTQWPSCFHRPYTMGIQQNAASPYNLGTTDQTTCGVVVLTSNTNITWNGIFYANGNTYPRTVKMTVESPWYQKIA